MLLNSRAIWAVVVAGVAVVATIVAYHVCNLEARRKLHHGKVHSGIERANLSKMVECADAARGLHRDQVVKSLWSDVVGRVDLLEKRNVRLPPDVCRVVTHRFCIDLFREGKYEEWIVAMWPASNKHEGNAVAVDSEEQSASAGGFDSPTHGPARLDDEAVEVSWEVRDPCMHCLPLKADDDFDKENFCSEVFGCFFNEPFYQMLRLADKPKLQSLFHIICEHMAQHPLSGHTKEVMQPLTTYVHCVVSLLFPMPYLYGCSPDDVQIVMVPSAKRKRLGKAVRAGHLPEETSLADNKSFSL